VFRKPSEIPPIQQPIFMAFRGATSVFLKYWLSEQRRPATLRSKGRGKMTKSQGKRVSKRVSIYLRVSTTEQTTINQRRELHAVAKRHGWSVVRSSRMRAFREPRVAKTGRRSTHCSSRFRAVKWTWWRLGLSIVSAGR
jgi:Resolvase, N terminal domain